jgi:hypothetical protein
MALRGLTKGLARNGSDRGMVTGDKGPLDIVRHHDQEAIYLLPAASGLLVIIHR